MPPILHLIDGHALAYRTYYALSAAGGNRFQTSTGEPTAGIYGFTSVLLRLLEQEKPEYIAVAFDTGKTFRDEIYPEYKGTREKMPDDLRPQIERIRQLVDAFNFPRLEAEGFEADDVLGSIAYQAVQKGFGVKIYTGDRDLLQLVNDRIIVNLPGRQLSDAKDYRADDVKAYMGVRPDQVVDFKALAGDSSDNIPGVQGIGTKTATSLLEEYDHLDNIYAHLEEIPSRVRNRLEPGRESAYLSYKLASIRTDVEISLDLEKAHIKNVDIQAVKQLFYELQFRTFTRKLEEIFLQSESQAQGEQLSLFGEAVTQVGVITKYQPAAVQIVDTEKSLLELCEKLKTTREFALDTETTSTDPMQAQLVGISVAYEEERGYYLPVGHQTQEPQLALELVVEHLGPILSDPEIAKIGHNLKYDGLVLSQHGMEVFPYSFDTMIAEWLAHPGSRHLGLKDMADKHLQIQMIHIEELIGKGKAQKSMAEVSVGDVAPYAAADAEVTLRLKPLMAKALQEQNAEKLFFEIEMPLIEVLAKMQQLGIALDKDFFKQFSKRLKERINEIVDQIYQVIGYEFNLNSTQQLSKALFESLGLEPPNRRKRTSSGLFSTSADVLEQIRLQHPVIALILEYRELSKLESTYVNTLPEQVNPKTGRIHSSFNQTGSVTGRLASSDPNLQNIPTRTELGNQVREGFVAGPGNVLLAIDYSQIELRIVAHMSQDEAMLEAFRAGQDIHATTAAAVYNIPLEEVTQDKRRHAKAINFGLIYGMSPFGLTQTTDLTLAEAENFVKAYFERFPGVKNFLDHLKKQAANRGYVETLLGRRRYFPNLKSIRNANLRNREEREAINAPIQGTAADIIKLAMIRLPEFIAQKQLHAKMLLQVHDELIFECPEAELDSCRENIQNIMENAYTLSIPLLTEAKAGKNWGSLDPLSNS